MFKITKSVYEEFETLEAAQAALATAAAETKTIYAELSQDTAILQVYQKGVGNG